MSSLYKDPLEVQAAYGEVNPPDDDIFYHPNQLSTRRIVKRFNSWLTVRFDVVVQMRWLNLTIVWTMYCLKIKLRNNLCVKKLGTWKWNINLFPNTQVAEQ